MYFFCIPIYADPLKYRTKDSRCGAKKTLGQQSWARVIFASSPRHQERVVWWKTISGGQSPLLLHFGGGSAVPLYILTGKMATLNAPL